MEQALVDVAAQVRRVVVFVTEEDKEECNLLKSSFIQTLLQQREFGLPVSFHFINYVIITTRIQITVFFLTHDHIHIGSQ